MSGPVQMASVSVQSVERISSPRSLVSQEVHFLLHLNSSTFCSVEVLSNDVCCSNPTVRGFRGVCYVVDNCILLLWSAR